jgi:hypothetical protein
MTNVTRIFPMPREPECGMIVRDPRLDRGVLALDDVRARDCERDAARTTVRAV